MDAKAPPSLASLWYEVVEDAELWQGDILRSLVTYALPQDLVVQREPTADARIEIKAPSYFGDWIVMSASCDLDRKLDTYPFVLVCRVWPASSENLNGSKGKNLDDAREVIRKGYDPLRFLLAEHPDDPQMDLSFALFRPHLTLPRDFLHRACVGKRLRLRPPYREWFGNWVGTNFSRVGIDDKKQIPPFGKPSTAARLAASEMDAAPLSKDAGSGFKGTVPADRGMWERLLAAARAAKKAWRE